MISPKTQRGSIAFWLIVAVFLLGVASLVYGLSSADRRPDLGLFTVSYLFLLGISQAGVVFTAFLRLVESDWGKPWYRLAELATLAYFPFAIIGFLLIFTYGRGDLFYWLQASPDDHISPWLDINWLLVRDLGGLLLFYLLAAIYVHKGLGPDLAGTAAAKSVDHDRVEKQLYLLSPVVLLGFVVSNTFIAWDLAMMLIPHWHSTVFPIHFWFGNIFAGTSAMIAFVVVMRKIDGGGHFGLTQVRSLGMLVTGFTLMWLYFFWAQFFVVWFGNLEQESAPLWRQMYGHYAPFFWIMISGCFFVPFVCLLFAVVKRSVLAMCLIAIGINLGIWINKYLMIMPVLTPDERPFDRWIDIALALGLLAGFLAMMIWLCRRLPVYAVWEMRREA
jgi:molybdopterin-containing oxidoreductase family membrane subunit